MTTSDEASETRGLDAGAVDFITKPINPKIVRARVKTHRTLKAQSELLRQWVHTDGLTGVRNRRYFGERLAEEWGRVQRHRPLQPGSRRPGPGRRRAAVPGKVAGPQPGLRREPSATPAVTGPLTTTDEAGRLQQTIEALRRSEERFRLLTELSSDWYWEQDAQGRFVQVSGSDTAAHGGAAAGYLGNRLWEIAGVQAPMAGWDVHRAVLHAGLPFHNLELRMADCGGRPVWMAISGIPVVDTAGQRTGYRGVGHDISIDKQAAITRQEEFDRLRATTRASARDLSPWQQEYRIRSTDGAARWLSGSSVPERKPDGSTLWSSVTTDITQRKLEQVQLGAALQEKSALLQEVHHRVKNNLQVIVSLLPLESRRGETGAVKTVLDDMQGRIRAMALLHESLYRTGVFPTTDLDIYLRELATQAFRALASNERPVRLELDLAPVRVGLNQGTPLGLQLVGDLAEQLDATLDIGPGSLVTMTFTPDPMPAALDEGA